MPATTTFCLRFYPSKNLTQALFSSFKLPKILQDSPFKRMHEALNIGKNTNYAVWL
jgi:hypothetical protein